MQLLQQLGISHGDQATLKARIRAADSEIQILKPDFVTALPVSLCSSTQGLATTLKVGVD